jgi:hypothetical protein
VTGIWKLFWIAGFGFVFLLGKDFLAWCRELLANGWVFGVQISLYLFFGRNELVTVLNFSQSFQ